MKIFGAKDLRGRGIVSSPCPPCVRGEQMLSCKEPGGLFAICELGNGALCAPFPDRARFLPRERVPSEARREGWKGRIYAITTTLPSGSFLACHGLGGARGNAASVTALPTMAKTSVRRARTPHRGDAYHARLTPCTGEAYEDSTTPPSCLRQATSPYTGEAILRNFTKFRKRLLTPEVEAKMRGLTYDKKGVALFWRV